MPRLFTAVRLPMDLRLWLTSLGDDMPGARWLTEDQAHLTLVFLGDVHTFRVADLHQALATVRSPPFELQLSGSGHFPGRGRPRAIWAGVADQPALTTLQARMVAALRRAGFEVQKRRFVPHVTLARLNGAQDRRVARFLEEIGSLRSDPFEVRAFHLFSSHLRAEGADYHLEGSFPLQD